MIYHQPVLLYETIDGLNIRPGGIYVDLTFGGGGHSREIIKKLKKGRLIAFDQDKDAESNVWEDNRLLFIRGNFRYVKNYLRFHSIYSVDGALADLGVSSHHFDVAGRGFSFRFDAELDMRMNVEAELTAGDILNTYEKHQLVKIFSIYGEIHNANRLADEIVRCRTESNISTIRQLLDCIKKYIPVRQENKYLAKVFQALRIEVNDELESLKEMMNQVTDLLIKGGRFVVITYHSLEDRLVKNFFRSGNFEGEIKKDFYGNPVTPYIQVNKSVIVPKEDEIRLNIRARSAKLRIAERQ